MSIVDHHYRCHFWNKYRAVVKDYSPLLDRSNRAFRQFKEFELRFIDNCTFCHVSSVFVVANTPNKNYCENSCSSEFFIFFIQHWNFLFLIHIVVSGQYVLF